MKIVTINRFHPKELHEWSWTVGRKPKNKQIKKIKHACRSGRNIYTLPHMDSILADVFVLPNIGSDSSVVCGKYSVELDGDVITYELSKEIVMPTECEFDSIKKRKPCFGILNLERKMKKENIEKVMALCQERELLQEELSRTERYLDCPKAGLLTVSIYGLNSAGYSFNIPADDYNINSMVQSVKESLQQKIKDIEDRLEGM